MARQHDHSCDCTKSELDLFALPPTQRSIYDGEWTDVHPLVNWTDSGPIEFHIPANTEMYTDLSNVQLYVKARIVKDGGGDMDGDDYSGPVNNWLHSLFEQVEVTMGNTIVSSATHTYPYRAYIENLISMGNDAKESQLTSCMFYKDEIAHMDGTSCKKKDNDGKTVAGNQGLKLRGGFTRQSAAVEMIGRLHCDIFNQERLLINEVPLRVKLIRSRNEFNLMSADGGLKAVIDEAVLWVRRVNISPAVYNAHNKALDYGPAKYPIRCIITKYFQIPTGATSTNQENLFQGQVPTRVIVGCVDAAAFNGDYQRNPFNFRHLNIGEMALYISGRKDPIKALKPDFPDHSLQSYVSFLTGVGKWGRDEGCGFNRKEHPNGYCLFAWDLTPDLAGGYDHFQLKHDSSVRLQIKFSEALTRAANVIVYAEFENLIMIDKDRNVTTNFKV